MMLPLTINFVFPRLPFKALYSKAPYHFKNLFLNPTIISLIRTKSPAYSNSLSAPHLVNFVKTRTTTAKRKGDSTNPWCIPTLTSNSSYNSESTLTLICTPSYRLFTDLSKTSGIPFFVVAHFNTFPGTVKSFL